MQYRSLRRRYMLNWDNIELPDGFTREDMLETIEYVSTMKAWDHFNKKNTLLGIEDLQQEIHLKCLKAMNRFNKDKIKDEKQIRRFFSTCADNHVKDLNRKHYYYHHVPCKKCPLACEKKGQEREFQIEENGCTKYHNKMHCDEYSKYMSLRDRKSSLGLTGRGGAAALAAEDHRIAGTSEREMIQQEKDLDAYIASLVGKSTYEAYEKLKDNYWNTSKLNEEEIQQLTEAIGRIFDIGGQDA